MKNVSKNQTKFAKAAAYTAVLAIGILIGNLFSTGGSANHNNPDNHNHEDVEWICSMHPQIRQDNFGRCPLCAMDLIPLKAGAGAADPNAVQMSDEAIALANIRTTTVGRAKPIRELRLFGTVTPNQRLVRSQSSHVNGRIERLAVSTVGENIRVGQTIATVYSPDLLNAQQELIEAKKLAAIQPALLNAAREKLRAWNLTEDQIEEIERSGIAAPRIDVRASVGGVVTERRVGQGDYVGVGTVLFDLVDLSSVWTVFDAFEADLPYIRVGDVVEYTLPSIPGRSFSGRVSFIEPMLDNATRTAKVRVESSNPRRELKPGMFANAVISATLRGGGEEMIIPKTAVLWTGRRSIVYVKNPDYETPTFTLREIELGPSLGGDYVVTSGIFDGEEIVTRGAFVIDASAQLEGRRSMMNLGDEEEGGVGAIEQAIMTVQGNCGMCKEVIETAAKGVPGVSVAMWDGGMKQLRLNFNPSRATLDEVGKAVAAAGYDNEKHRADDAVYNALHECCLYRE